MTPRGTVKTVALVVATVFIWPLLLVASVQGLAIGRDRALQYATQALALLPGLTGQYLRRAFLMRRLDSCHRSATIDFGTTFSKAGARIGADAYVGPMCHIGLAYIGAGVLIGPSVHIPSGPRTHGIDEPGSAIRDQPGVLSIVRIGDGAWIGSGAVIMADVGVDSVVGAGAIVTRAVPNHAVVAGNPARVIRFRGSEGATASAISTRPEHDRP